MEVGDIRAAFIRANLRRALSTDDASFALSAAYEFRRYFEWFAYSIEEPDRKFVSDQLRLLEESWSKNRRQPLTESTRR